MNEPMFRDKSDPDWKKSDRYIMDPAGQKGVKTGSLRVMNISNKQVFIAPKERFEFTGESYTPPAPAPKTRRVVKVQKSMDELMHPYLNRTDSDAVVLAALREANAKDDAAQTSRRGIDPIEHFKEDKGFDAESATRHLRDLYPTVEEGRRSVRLIPVNKECNERKRYVLDIEPPKKSEEQRTREAIISVMAKMFAKAFKLGNEDTSVEEEEQTELDKQRDSVFAKAVRKASNDIDFLGGTDTNVHEAMHIFRHADGGKSVDVRSNGVLGDCNTNRQDTAGTLNFYVKGNKKVVVISSGYRKGEYTLPTLFDSNEEQAQKVWIILANMSKKVSQDVPEWFWSLAEKYVHKDCQRVWQEAQG